MISYRRGDSAGYAGRLAGDLSDRFGAGQVFRDVEHLPLGANWLAEIDRAVVDAAAVIVVMGPNWVTNRLLDSGDVVRHEVACALASGRPVIPVLVGGAAMPSLEQLPLDLRAVREWQALDLSDSRWPSDVARLVAALEGLDSACEILPFPEVESASRYETRDAWFARRSLEQVRAQLDDALVARHIRIEEWEGDAAELAGGAKASTRTLGGFWVRANRLPSTGRLRLSRGLRTRVEILLREDFGTGHDLRGHEPAIQAMVRELRRGPASDHGRCALSVASPPSSARLNRPDVS